MHASDPKVKASIRVGRARGWGGPSRDSTEGRIGWDGSGRGKDWGWEQGPRGRLRLGEAEAAPFLAIATQSGVGTTLRGTGQ